MKTRNNEGCIDVCNNLLAGEIAAIETYSQAIHTFPESVDLSIWEGIRNDHVASANWLRDNVRDMGGKPVRDSGVWGVWARMVEGAAKIVGETVAMKALQEGEEHGEKEYDAALENDEVMESCKDVIRSELLPRQRRHISTLRGMVRAR